MHLHPWKLEYDVAKKAARIAQRNIGSLLTTRGRNRQVTPVVVMLDDYFLTGKPSRVERIVEQAKETIIDAALEVGLVVDLVVRESAMAEVAQQALELIEPRNIVDGVLQADAPYRRFGIEEVPLWTEDSGERQWTCPFLAAVWQLVRLGLVELEDALVTVVGRDLPLVTEETLTLLSSRYLATEAAVQAVCATLRTDALRGLVSDSASHLFIPDAEQEGSDTPYTGPAALIADDRRDAAMSLLGRVGGRAVGVQDFGILVVDSDDLSRPYAAWEIVEVGPETLAIGREVAPTLADVREGVRAVVELATREGFDAVITTSGGREGEIVKEAGFKPAVSSSGWEVFLWTSPAAHGSAHRVASGWLRGTNPPMVDVGDFRLRDARLEDIDAIVLLDGTEYLDPLPAGQVATLVANYPCVVAEEGGALCGFAVSRPLPGTQGRVGELYTIMTQPERRGSGIGAALLATFEAKAWLYGWEAVWLESSLAYKTRYKGSPTPFYQRCGWTLVGETSRTIYMAKPRPGSAVTVHESGRTP